jgi:hypothetical protein
VRNRLHGDFDRGFFSAWADCMRVFSRITIPKNVTTTNVNGAVSEQARLETVESDENQATIEDSIEEED